MLDAGQVGTEMLYFLVGSRELDGGLMCTASHNPKAYTGAKLVREGAIALSGDAGHRATCARSSRPLGAAGERRRRGGARSRRSTSTTSSRPRRCASSTRTRSLAALLKVVVDGGNGMAGPMVGPLLERLDLELIDDLLDAGRQLPRPRAQPAAAREPRADHRAGARDAAPTSGSPGTATPTAASSSTSTGAFVDGDFLTALLAESLLRKNPGEAILYDVRASRAVADTVTAAGGTPFINRVGHAFFKTRMREEGSLFGGEVSGHYYFRDFYCADSGTIPALLMLELLRARGQAAVGSCSRPTASATSSPARSTPRSPTRRRRSRRSPSATPTPRQTRLDGISIDYDDWHFNVRPSNTEPLLRLCLESLVSPGGHGAAARRGARADPLRERLAAAVSEQDERREQEARERLAQAAEAGIHRLAIPTPFQVGRVNAYLIEDAPLTLVDSGPNSGKALDELERALAGLGHTVEDLELLIVTHQHIDHFGLASILARRSGAEVAALDRLAPFLASFGARRTSTTPSRRT